MNTQLDVYACKHMFAALSCATLLAFSTIACDSDVIDTSTNTAEIAELSEITAGSLALVSQTPDPIDGLSPVGFDEERQVYVYDRDNDGFPDITEVLEGTDMFDPDSNLRSDVLGPPDAQAGFPAGNCRSGFVHAGSRLCITQFAQNARQYRSAVVRCRSLRSNVCSYEDLSYLYIASSLDASFNPNGRWIGNMPADDQVLCGNRSVTFNGDPDIANFEGTCNKSDNRSFWCCHDDE